MGKKKEKSTGRTWEHLVPSPFLTSPNAGLFPDRYMEKEVWRNNIYTVFVKRGLVMGGGLKFTWLSIKRNDKEPAKNWRHFQYIKNQLVGPENEGAELYPKESRLVDGSNQYHMWVLEDVGLGMPFGFTDGRTISSEPLEGGKQSPWEDNMVPPDLEKMNQRTQELFEKIKEEKIQDDLRKKF
jgi:hypothetical protein